MKLTPFLLLATTLAVANAQPKTQCTNPSLSWTIHQSYTDPITAVTYSSAIFSDSSQAYVDGTPGVVATLFLCDSKTLDATLTLGNPRAASISFSQILSIVPGATPSWAASGLTATGLPAMDVRSLGYVPAGNTRSQEFSFTTRFNTSVPESGNWALLLVNPNPSAPSLSPSGGAANPPNAAYYDSLVNVQHCPANDNFPVSALCSPGAAETWIVWPDSTSGPPQVGTLLNTKHTPGVNSGQFSIPFYFTISLQ